MNLIDFHVTKILEEKRDKVYKLYGMTEIQARNEEDECWVAYLLGDGVKQTYEYWDDGGTRIETVILNLQYDKPYYVGYIGQH